MDVAGLPFGGNSGNPSTGEPDLASLPAPGAAPQEQKRSKREDKRAAKQQAKYGVFDPNELKKGRGFFGFLATGGGKLTVASVVLALIAGAGVYVYTVDNSTQIQQLILKNPTPANTLLTPDDVVPVEVPENSVQDPTTLVTMGNIQSGTAYTKVALLANTVLTKGSIGPYARLSKELPEGQQLVSITVEPSNAAGGSVTAGDIVNIFGNSDTAPVFTNGMKGIKVLDVIVSPDSIAKSATQSDAPSVGADSPDLKSGIGSVYKLSVTPEQAGEIAKAVVSGTTFYLVLTRGVSDAAGQSLGVGEIPTAPVPNPVLDPVASAIDGASDILNGGGTGSSVAPSDTATVEPSASAQADAPVNPNMQPTTTPSPQPSASAR